MEFSGCAAARSLRAAPRVRLRLRNRVVRTVARARRRKNDRIAGGGNLQRDSARVVRFRTGRARKNAGATAAAAETGARADRRSMEIVSATLSQLEMSHASPKTRE